MPDLVHDHVSLGLQGVPSSLTMAVHSLPGSRRQSWIGDYWKSTKCPFFPPTAAVLRQFFSLTLLGSLVVKIPSNPSGHVPFGIFEFRIYMYIDVLLTHAHSDHL